MKSKVVNQELVVVNNWLTKKLGETVKIELHIDDVVHLDSKKVVRLTDLVKLAKARGLCVQYDTDHCAKREIVTIERGKLSDRKTPNQICLQRGNHPQVTAGNPAQK